MECQGNNIGVGYQLLLRQKKVDKLSTPFHETPFEVVDKYHSQVTVQSPEGVNYKRNSSHVKKFETGQESASEPASVGDSFVSEDSNHSECQTKQTLSYA